MTTGVRPVLLLAIVAAAALLGNGAWARADSGVLERFGREGTWCATSATGPGYRRPMRRAWSGIGVDFYGAVAAAAIGSRKPSSSARSRQRGTAILQSGEVDVLSSNLAMTSSRDTGLGVGSPASWCTTAGLHGAQSQSLTSALELAGARICVTRERRRAGPDRLFHHPQMPFDLVKFDSWPDAVMASHKAARCSRPT